MKERGEKRATADGERNGGVGEKRETREEQMKTGTANRPKEKIRLKKRKRTRWYWWSKGKQLEASGRSIEEVSRAPDKGSGQSWEGTIQSDGDQFPSQ